MAPLSSFNLSQIKADLFNIYQECSQRGLLQSAKWAAEMVNTLWHVQLTHFEGITSILEDEDFSKDLGKYVIAKSYLDLREYDRAAFFTEECTTSKACFIHYYARYLSGEKKKNDDIADSIAPSECVKNQELRCLRSEMHKQYANKQLDGFALYVYGVILKKLELSSEAVKVLTEAIHKQPLHWGSWLELSSLISDKEMLSSLSLPDNWVKHFFMAHTYLELQLNDDALTLYYDLQDSGFQQSTYILAQIAIAYHNKRDIDQAVDTFQKLRETDPYRLDNMDTYSNLLYVKEMRVELSHLAHHTCEIDKYRVETCCVIGNYYSLRSQHEKAVVYFQRALKLNPQYLAAWTLMGHEFMEMKNTAAAIQSYRQAIEVNKRDYRAWYGLGQTYEILKMPYYCLYYYRQAQQLRPNDSRMLVALGESYEKLERLEEALKCFWKAHSVGDLEGIALIRLAKLYARLGEHEQASAAYANYVNECEEHACLDKDELCHAYLYLTNIHLKHARLDEAYKTAQKCTEFQETKEEAKALLRQVAQLRSQQDTSMVVEESSIIGTVNQLAQADPNRETTMNVGLTPQ